MPDALPDSGPTPEAREFFSREIMPWLMVYSKTPSIEWDAAGAALLDAFRREGVEKAYKHCLQLADDMTNQRALIRTLMPLAGVSKFERTAKCLVCLKNPRAEDGGMLCQPCRDNIDRGDSL